MKPLLLDSIWQECLFFASVHERGKIPPVEDPKWKELCSIEANLCSKIAYCFTLIFVFVGGGGYHQTMLSIWTMYPGYSLYDGTVSVDSHKRFWSG